MLVYSRSIIRQFADRLTPAACLLCHGATQGPRLICGRCSNDLPRFNCACTEAPSKIDLAICAFSYRFPVNRLIQGLKYDQRLIVAHELGLCLASLILKVSTHLPECVLPVPLHRYRYIRRGYNQALEIANTVSRQLGIPVNAGMLVRSRNTAAQFDLEPRQRKDNVRNAFSLGARPEYRSVAILDDVITTGATVNEIARLLKKSGVRHVQAWACARAEK